MLGAARTEIGGNRRLDPGTNWTFPIYSCATALKASIKDVTFRINSSASLSNLHVVNVSPQKYSSEKSLPLWAVENSGMNISEIVPFWGVVDDKYESTADLFTRRAASLYLPAGQSEDSVISTASDSAAGARGPLAVLTALYDTAASSAGTGSTQGVPDYSGYSNYPTFLKWQGLSRTAQTSSNILNLIWTDLAANYLMGATIGVSSGDAASASATRQVEVQSFSHRITYDIRYAIPAFVFLLIYVAIFTSALLLWILRRARFAYLRSLLNQTATGRAATMEGAGKEFRTLSTRKWITTYGNTDIGIRKKSDTHGDHPSPRNTHFSDGSVAADDQLIENQSGGRYQAVTSDKNDLVPHVREVRRGS
jgi:hypothetical protein